MDVIARGLTVTRGGRRLLDAVDLDLEPGTLTAVIGPNGAGKTTLLRALTGECPADSGTVHLGGEALQGWSPRSLARIRAVLPQHSELAFAFTVEEVVEMGRFPFDEPRAASRAVVRDALERLGITALASRSWLTLSGGERQRVQLARVLAQVAGLARGVVFLDEPTNHLDLAHQVSALMRVRQRVREGLTALAILHDLSLAARIADQVVVLHQGAVAAAGSPRDAMDSALLQEVFAVPLERVSTPGGPAWIPRLDPPDGPDRGARRHHASIARL